MAFAQLTFRESLRDIQACLRVAQSKPYHMGFRGTVARNTLAHANEVRAWQIYADFVQGLIVTARTLYTTEEFGVELAQTVYALDTTVIDLYLALFPWAAFCQRQGAVKLHTLLDLRGSIPTVFFITPGGMRDVNILDQSRSRQARSPSWIAATSTSPARTASTKPWSWRAETWPRPRRCSGLSRKPSPRPWAAPFILWTRERSTSIHRQ
jgi:hypothetical protein